LPRFLERLVRPLRSEGRIWSILVEKLQSVECGSGRNGYSLLHILEWSVHALPISFSINPATSPPGGRRQSSGLTLDGRYLAEYITKIAGRSKKMSGFG
jgi:hypothetical protein